MSCALPLLTWCRAVENVSFVISTFSCVGSLFIISCYLYYKDLRKFAFKLVFILSFMDLVVRAPALPTFCLNTRRAELHHAAMCKGRRQAAG